VKLNKDDIAEIYWSEGVFNLYFKNGFMEIEFFKSCSHDCKHSVKIPFTKLKKLMHKSKLSDRMPNFPASVTKRQISVNIIRKEYDSADDS
jgi:hypothetical protein